MTLIITIAGIAVPLLIWYISRKSPEIVYAVSSPVSLSDQTDKVAQQLEIINRGNVQAKNLIIKVRAPVLAFTVLPYATSDVHTSESVENGVEIRYDKLPPSGKFSIAVTAKKGHQVISSDVVIAHEEGSGKDWLEGKSRLSSQVVSIVIASVFGLLLAFLVRGGLMSSLASDARYQPQQILTRSTPWYCSDDDWHKLQQTAVDSVASAGFYLTSHVHAWPTYIAIDSDHFLKLSEDHKSTIAKAFVKQCNELSNSRRFYEPQDVNSMINARRPKHLDAGVWSAMIDGIAREQIAFTLERMRWFSTRPSGDMMVFDRAVSVSDDVLKQKLSDAIVADIVIRAAVDSSDASARLEALNKYIDERGASTAERVIGVFGLLNGPDVFTTFGAQKFLEQQDKYRLKREDAAFLTSLAKATISLKDAEERTDIELSIANAIVNTTPLPSQRPSHIDEERWKRVVREHQAVSKARTLESEVTQMQVQLREDRKKVFEQLRIISNMFERPSSIFEVEPEDVPFADGNWRNLKLLAQHLSASTSK